MMRTDEPLADLFPNMRRISSKWTWWYKKAFPLFWFGFLGLFTIGWSFGVIQQKVPAPTLLLPLVMAAIGYVLMKWLLFPLVDEVWIDQNEIVVWNSGQEGRFPITNIINVEDSQFMNPERVTLTLKEPCALGSEIVFLPPLRLLHFTRHPIAQELIQLANGLDTKE
jgi:hypothetical protein